MAAPIKETCPDIDKAIKCLKTAISEIEDAIEDKQTVRSIVMEIEDAIDYFNDLRKANDILRSWGYDLEIELHDAAETINNLETKLEHA